MLALFDRPICCARYIAVACRTCMNTKLNMRHERENRTVQDGGCDAEISRIHHYTSVETLALILVSKKIRFNRTDKVDDLTESRRHPRVRFGSYFFVSCWTYDEQESIPQWHMYTDRMRGVRVSLPVMPFQQKRLIPPPQWNLKSQGVLYAPLSLEEIFGQDHFVLPMFLDLTRFGGPVEYCDDVETRYENAITLDQTNGLISGQISRPFDLVRLKRSEWSFQKEYRFSLFVLPSIPVPEEGPGAEAFVSDFPNHVANALHNGIAPGITYLDVDLSDEALQEMEIVLGPLCSEGSKLAVQALIAQYAPHARVSESRFTGDIRDKAETAL